MFPRASSRRWLLLGLALAILLGGVATAYVLLTRSEENVSNPDVEFEPQAKPPPQPQRSHYSWPVYGLTAQRTRYLRLKHTPRPPYTFTWAVRGSVLLEFPPVAGGRQLFLLKNNGALYGIGRVSGRVRWRKKIGRLAASSPAYSKDTVYCVMLKAKHSRRGSIVAVNTDAGQIRWRRKLPSRAESSPLVRDGLVIFGTEDGTIYALRKRNGSVKWRYKAGGAVKAGLAYDRGKLFFGDYDGRMHAIRASNGRKLWVKDAGGRFYSTPAVAYGRVYVGNLRGSVSSFSAENGSLAWRRSTGDYVYSSPAVADVGGRATVYIGSYDRKLYALDARNGRVRWARDTGGRVSGGPVVIGDLVFVSNLARRTVAYGARTGNKVWSTNKGAFNPAISDGRRIFLVGYSSLFAMKSKARPKKKQGRERRPRRSAAERAEAKRRRKFRRAPHGHRHRGPLRTWPRCHRHLTEVRRKKRR